MKKLLSTLLAVLLAVTMLTGMAIPAQAAENDIFNPGVLELDGSAAVTLSKTMNAAYFTQRWTLPWQPLWWGLWVFHSCRHSR